MSVRIRQGVRLCENVQTINPMGDISEVQSGQTQKSAQTKSLEGKRSVTALAEPSAPMVDPYGRTISYLRMSVTDRCDFRCVYCMAEDMTFLPKTDVLSLEELERLAGIFIQQGVRRLRLTGGEPLVRRNVIRLIERLGRHLDSGDLEELTLTTNGSQLARFADRLSAAGIRRINVSLDSLDPDRFRALTRWGEIGAVLQGLEAAQAAGLEVKINTVALAGINEDELDRLLTWCGTMGFDLTLIEVMPLGDIDGDGGSHTRAAQFLPLSKVRADLERRWTLIDLSYRTGGPARYTRVAETGRRLGFITPLTHNFCESCNRVRLTCTGTLFMCLGQNDATDLRAVLRANPDDDAPVRQALHAAIQRKPRGHDFVIDRRQAGPSVSRHMSTTGG